MVAAGRARGVYVADADWVAAWAGAGDGAGGLSCGTSWVAAVVCDSEFVGVSLADRVAADLSPAGGCGVDFGKGAGAYSGDAKFAPCESRRACGDVDWDVAQAAADVGDFADERAADLYIVFATLLVAELSQ